MAKISQREKVLLGYSPNNSVSNCSSRRSSEVDFSDVFGGPPRRSSIQETFNNEDINNGVDDDDDDDDDLGNSWLGFREKPVFGDEIGLGRKYGSEDFFEDIFRGGKQQPLSCSQSPTIRAGRDPFRSAPGSRLVSPAPPLPPAPEPFASPVKFSLPARLAHTDFQASTSMNQNLNSPSPSLSRFNKTIENYDARESYRPSPLSRQISLDDSKLDGSLDGAQLRLTKDSKGSEVPNDSTQFHFSIYKWASKGVPLVISFRKRSPSKSKERIKVERCLSANERVGKNNEVDIPVNVSLSFNKSRIQSTSGTKDCKDFGNFQGMEKQVHEEAISYGLEDPTEATTNIRKFNPSPLNSLPEERKGNKTVIAKKGRKESMVREKEKSTLDDAFSSRKVNNSKVHESFREAKDDLREREVPGKVKEFVKIFNQENLSKATTEGLGGSQSWRRRDTTTFEAENEIKTKKHDEKQVSGANWEKTWLEASEVVDGNSFLSEEQHYDVQNIGSISDTATPVFSNEPNAAAPNTNASSDDHDIMNEFLQNIHVQSQVEYQEETKDYGSKVQQWSKGKEGNIRALLSTLQYIVAAIQIKGLWKRSLCVTEVLWPNSGWKPVPLVDIIEANSVKRAYQRAMLCLHPDKLQQKGAATHHKFIAEKVFDILQDAWDHFNSLGSL